MQALRGACRVLQRAHVPFGVITSRQLGDLNRYKVVVLPNVQRMDAGEVEAFREYVRRGGRLYASRYTSLVETQGVHHDDLMLADVLGVHVEREEPTRAVYAKPATPAMAAWLDPQRYLTAVPATGALAGGLLRLRAEPAAEVLATLTLPYAHPHVGSFGDRDWASIHSFPPTHETSEPMIVAHRFGEGRAIYSSVEIEREEADANGRLFARLIGDLLGDEQAVRCDVRPEVWVSAFHMPEEPAIRVALRNGPPQVVTPAEVRVRAPEGARFVGLEELPSGRPVPFETDGAGTLRCTLGQVPELTMLLARYER
jgi:hypothetical protein